METREIYMNNFLCPGLEESEDDWTHSYRLLPKSGYVEYEAFGGVPEGEAERTKPGGYPFASPAELLERLLCNEVSVRESDAFHKLYGQLKDLRNGSAAVCLEGPFSVLCMVVRPEDVFRAMRKQPDTIRQVLDAVCGIQTAHAKRLLSAGARILSVADPIAGADILGPRNYPAAADALLRMIREILPFLDGQAIHLCGRTSRDLEDKGRIRREQIECSGTYEECIWLAAKTGVKLLGNGCLRNRSVRTETIAAYHIAE